MKIDSLLPNGGFEWGPAFLDSSGEEVLQVTEPSLAESTVQQWTTMGTAKYINSKTSLAQKEKVL